MTRPTMPPARAIAGMKPQRTWAPDLAESLGETTELPILLTCSISSMGFWIHGTMPVGIYLFLAYSVHPHTARGYNQRQLAALGKSLLGKRVKLKSATNVQARQIAATGL